MNQVEGVGLHVCNSRAYEQPYGNSIVRISGTTPDSPDKLLTSRKPTQSSAAKNQSWLAPLPEPLQS